MQLECLNFFAPRRGRLFIFGWKIVLVGVVVAVLGANLGCRNPKPPPSPKPFAGRKVTIAAADDAILSALLQRHSRAWSDSSGASVEFVRENEPNADIRVFAPYQLPDLVSKNLLQPLPIEMLNAPTFEFVSVLRPFKFRLSEWQSTTYAIPLSGENIVAIVRSDLLATPVHRDAINQRLKRPLKSEEPLTWQQVAVIAEYFSTTAKWSDGDEAATPRTSLAPLPADAGAFDREFHLVATSLQRRATAPERFENFSEEEKYRHLYDYHFDARTGACRIADPGFVAALSLLRQLQKYRPQKSAEDPATVFQQGQAVFAIVTLADIARLQASDSPVKDKFSVCAIPGSDLVFDDPAGKGSSVTDSNANYIPYLGSTGWMAGLAQSATDAASATDLLMTIGSREVALQITFEPSWGAGPTRMVQFEAAHRSGWHNYGLSLKRTNQLVSALERTSNTSLVNPVYRLRIPKEREYVTTFARRARTAIIQGDPPQETLKEIAKQWESIEPDQKVRLQQYRRSLGLE